MIPEKLKEGDMIRVISPARSLSLLGKETIEIATQRLNDLGLEVTFSKNSLEMDDFCSSSIESRISDLHEAFSDTSVKGILTTIGGFNSNQLLSHIDFDLIRANPKILCGFSDITALTSAIYAKTGLTTYSGVHFSSFGMKKGFEYSLEHFQKCLMEDSPFELRPSTQWSNDAWWEDQDSREFHENEGWQILNHGNVSRIEGKILGGNISSLASLHGTEFMPVFERDTILFIEECAEQTVEFFDRILQSLIHQKGFDNVKALLIGRFEPANNMTAEKLRAVIDSKRSLKDLLVVSNLDFGHTAPIFTFPLGAPCKIELGDQVAIQIG